MISGVKRAFTLIELLVTIAVLGVIAAGVVALIDPLDKLKAARDAKVESDIGQIATALQAYATVHTGAYPCKTGGLLGCPNPNGQDGLAALVSNGDLTSVPAPPTNYVCNTGGMYEDGYVFNGTSVELKCQLQAKRYVNSGLPVWAFCSSSGQIGQASSFAVGDCP